MAQARNEARDIRIPPIGLAGILHFPRDAYAIVAFVHGSGSSRLSPRNRAVADALNARGMATLLFDLLTYDEELDRANVFDISLLADRLAGVVSWLDAQPSLARLPLGLFGASTGAAAALVAAAKRPQRVRAVVSRGGRPDLAGDALNEVHGDLRNMWERLRQGVSSGSERKIPHFDSFECAIHALAPKCAHCGIRIVGHGLEKAGTFFCCEHCAEGEGVSGLRDRL